MPQVVIHHPRCKRSVDESAECTLNCAGQPVSVEPLRTKIILTDQRIVAIGHSGSKAACIALTAAVQTAARIANRMGLLEAVPTLEEGEKPLYDVYMRACDEASALVAGVRDALDGIESVAPGSLEIRDVRKQA